MALTASFGMFVCFYQVPTVTGRGSGVVRILMQFQCEDLEHFRSLCYTDRPSCKWNPIPGDVAVFENAVTSSQPPLTKLPLPIRSVDMICRSSLGSTNDTGCKHLVSFCIDACLNRPSHTVDLQLAVSHHLLDLALLFEVLEELPGKRSVDLESVDERSDCHQAV